MSVMVVTTGVVGKQARRLTCLRKTATQVGATQIVDEKSPIALTTSQLADHVARRTREDTV